ncbi:hypothetical protein SAMN05216344_11943 [Polaromonas sp. OV174]|uniref:hypothetical protein n=1 Tax=Polaromonas sp. OV174 TaxID=1855300 RepID=UPI0008F31340|nr:hypothetical protein [Polaromonas sp. OV174]SFC49003.1 hypothetical protein SAMN05216344_11943 [Polaromonas sp. OV174]
MKKTVKPLLLSGLVALGCATALWTGTAQAATPYVSATVEGALAPGVYGRVDIGNAPPPPLIYAQPIIIQRPPVMVQQPPLYLHVPPGHAKKWSKHCARYNACGQPVYFVKVRGDDNYERRGGRDKHHGNDDHDGHGKRHGHDKDKHGGGHRH